MLHFAMPVVVDAGFVVAVFDADAVAAEGQISGKNLCHPIRRNKLKNFLNLKNLKYLNLCQFFSTYLSLGCCC